MGKILVNFDEQLVILIREAKYLDRMGFAVPETALNVTLQEDKYKQYVENLNAMLSSYFSVIDSLSAVETELLQGKITDLTKDLSRGFNLLNWNSLSIPEFTGSCNRAINNFQTIVKQTQKNAGTIKGVVDAIATCQLVKVPKTASIGEVPELAELPTTSRRRATSSSRTSSGSTCRSGRCSSRSRSSSPTPTRAARRAWPRTMPTGRVRSTRRSPRWSRTRSPRGTRWWRRATRALVTRTG